MKTYQIGYYPGGVLLSANWTRIGHGVRDRKRAFRLVYWLRKRGVLAFAF